MNLCQNYINEVYSADLDLISDHKILRHLHFLDNAINKRNVFYNLILELFLPSQ